MNQDQFNYRIINLLARILAECGGEKQSTAMAKIMAEIMAEIVSLQRELPIKSGDSIDLNRVL